MTSVPPEAVYPLNEIYLLSKFDVSSFSMTRDFQTGHFADFQQLRIGSQSAKFGQDKRTFIVHF